MGVEFSRLLESRITDVVRNRQSCIVTFHNKRQQLERDQTKKTIEIFQNASIQDRWFIKEDFRFIKEQLDPYFDKAETQNALEWNQQLFADNIGKTGFCFIALSSPFIEIRYTRGINFDSDGL